VFLHRNCSVTQKRPDTRAIVTLEREQTLACGLSKAVVFSDLEWTQPRGHSSFRLSSIINHILFAKMKSYIQYKYGRLPEKLQSSLSWSPIVTWNQKLSWCWQTRATRLEVSQGHQTQYHSIC